MSHIVTNTWNDEYWKMIEQWRIIVSQPLPDDEKQNACLTILHDQIGRIALSHVHRLNPSLRFWADMVLLKQRLSPEPGSGDELSRLAIIPAWRLVWDWLKSNEHGTSTCGSLVPEVPGRLSVRF